MSLFNFFRRNNCNDNFKRLLSICQSIVRDATSNQYSGSCDTILNLVSNFLSNVAPEKDYIPDSDLTEIALVVIGNCIYDALSSGKFHIYSGTLSPLGSDMYNAYLKILLQYKNISGMPEEEYRETLRNLHSNIKLIG